MSNTKGKKQPSFLHEQHGALLNYRSNGHLILFSYVQMYGIQLAFGRLLSDMESVVLWVGLEHFKTFFQSFNSRYRCGIYDH